MIDLNEFSETNNDVLIFNNGDAGRVTDLSVSVKKKTAEDNQNAPDYKIHYTQANGADVNDGIYYPQDSDGNPGFVLKRLVTVLHAVNPESKDVALPTFPSYTAAVDFLMKKINEAGKQGHKVNVFVNYGVKQYPKNYLTVRKINFVESSSKDESLSRLKAVKSTDVTKVGYNDIMSRPEPDNNEDVFQSKDNSPANDEATDDFF